jgi:hypothetical protein
LSIWRPATSNGQELDPCDRAVPLEGHWVFDDPRVDLHREPFVSGADVMMDSSSDSSNGFHAVPLIRVPAKPRPLASSVVVPITLEKGPVP